MKLIPSLISLWLVISLVVFPSGSLAQSAPSSPTRSSTASAQVKRGEGLFLQRCSICHLDKPLKPKTKPSFGPKLNGLFKSAEPNKEKIVREVILKGSPDMPGFQYALDTMQINDLIAYLKTL